MKTRITVFIIIVAVLFGCFLIYLLTPAKQKTPSDITSQDEPAAHALYVKMIETMRQAQTLSYQSEYKYEAKG